MRIRVKISSSNVDCVLKFKYCSRAGSPSKLAILRGHEKHEKLSIDLIWHSKQMSCNKEDVRVRNERSSTIRLACVCTWICMYVCRRKHNLNKFCKSSCKNLFLFRLCISYVCINARKKIFLRQIFDSCILTIWWDLW